MVRWEDRRKLGQNRFSKIEIIHEILKLQGSQSLVDNIWTENVPLQRDGHSDWHSGYSAWITAIVSEMCRNSPGDGVLLPAHKCAPQGAVIELGWVGAVPGANVGMTTMSLLVWGNCCVFCEKNTVDKWYCKLWKKRKLRLCSQTSWLGKMQNNHLLFTQGDVTHTYLSGSFHYMKRMNDSPISV